MFPDTNHFTSLPSPLPFRCLPLYFTSFTFYHSGFPIYLLNPLYHYPYLGHRGTNLYLSSSLPTFISYPLSPPSHLLKSHFSFYINRFIFIIKTSEFVTSTPSLTLSHLTLAHPCTDTLFTCDTTTLFVFTVSYAHFTLPTRREGCETTSFTIEIFTDSTNCS